jgi:hypothetical protein
MRPREIVLRHLELFAQILEQHNLGSFPTSFVPCAFRHRFSENQFGENGGGLADLLRQSGINFISTPFFTMHGGEKLKGKRFGFDGSVLTVDRARDLQSWYVIGTPPVGEFENAICGMHWPNLLHLDPERNEEIVAAWVVFLREQNHRFDRVLAPDTNFFAGQLLHHDATKCEVENQTLHLNWSQTATLLTGAVTEFIVKIAADVPLEFSSDEIEIVSVEAETMADDANSRQTISVLKLRSGVAQKTARIHAVRAASKASL